MTDGRVRRTKAKPDLVQCGDALGQAGKLVRLLPITWPIRSHPPPAVGHQCLHEWYKARRMRAPSMQDHHGAWTIAPFVDLDLSLTAGQAMHTRPLQGCRIGGIEPAPAWRQEQSERHPR